MTIKKEFEVDFQGLKDLCWSGAIDTLNRIEELGFENEFMEILEEEFCGEILTDTEINDFIWFEDNTINEWLGRNTCSLYDDEENEE